jgi:putative nucleotidyltransferase with HDIG domain
MKVETLIERKIRGYNPRDGLGHTARLFLALCGVNHPQVKGHTERVALLAEAVAIELKKDPKAAFFAGLLHDIGKLILPYELFDGHNINNVEYTEVKKHALAGFKVLKQLHYFTAFCAGLHHALYTAGYGLSIKDFPAGWSPSTIKKVLEISVIISICDFIDAFTHRKTEIKDNSDKNTPDLKGMLEKKYSDDHQVIDIALKIQKNMKK